MPLPAKPPSESATDMVEVVLPNDTNPMGFMLGGAVMHLIDLAGAIAAFRHARALMVTAAVDGLEFLNPIKVGDFIVLKARPSLFASKREDRAVPGFLIQRRTGKGYRIEASVEPRYLLREPSLEPSKQNLARAVFGLFLIREWRF